MPPSSELGTGILAAFAEINAAGGLGAGRQFLLTHAGHSAFPRDKSAEKHIACHRTNMKGIKNVRLMQLGIRTPARTFLRSLCQPIKDSPRSRLV